MPSEVRTFPEGTLRAVQASGSGRTWSTAATPNSALFAYVQAGKSVQSARTMNAIMERGVPDHWKFGEATPITVTFTVKQTGAISAFLTASGASVPLLHLEHRASATENGAATGIFNQFMGCVIQSIAWTENPDGNTIQFTFGALACTLFTASGFLST